MQQTRNDTAVFPNAPYPRTVILNSSSIEISEVRFDNDMTYWLFGSGSLYFPPAGLGSIHALRGNHIIGVPIDLQKDITFDIAANNSLTVLSPNNLLRGSGGITKTGAGDLYLLTPNEHRGKTIINNGSVIIADDQVFGTSKLELLGGQLINIGSYRVIANQVTTFNNNFTFASRDYRLSFSTPLSLPGNRLIVVEGDVTFAGVTDPAKSRNLRKPGSGNLTINLSGSNNIGAFVRNEGSGQLNLYGSGIVGAIIFNSTSGGGEIGIGDQRDVNTGAIIRGQGVLSIEGNGDGARLHGPDIRLRFDIGPSGDKLVLKNTTNNRSSNAKIELIGIGNPDGAELELALVPGYTPNTGDSWTIIEHQATGGIIGTFRSLPNNTVVKVSGYPFKIVYETNKVYLVALPQLVVNVYDGNNQSALLNTDFT